MTEAPRGNSPGDAPRERSGRSSSGSGRGESPPALSPGARLGRYEIVELLGSGGMGEVYVARDVRLGRKVALKVLPSFYAEDPARLRRFEREARTASLLNHPNIVAIYDVGSFRNKPYLVTELLEGRTLRAELDAGALPIERVLRYGIQVARALAAAHERGVVHRDLKPANVFVTGDGSLKLLDFGLAKLVYPDRESAESEDDTVSSPTVTQGAIGSSGYMSPEQVQGLPVDHRSDIFSFGILLYEMVSGSSPFRRSSTVETLHAIVKDRPPPLEEEIPEVPASLAAIVRRCLEKRPDDRFHSARDLVFTLQEILGEVSSSGSGVSNEGTWTFGPVSTWRAFHHLARKVRVRPIYLLALVGVVGLWLALLVTNAIASSETRASEELVTSRSLGLSRVTSTGSVGDAVAISPDGRFVAYDQVEGERWAIWLHHIRTGSRVAILEDASVAKLRFTPEGDHLYLVKWEDEGLYRMPILGGNPQPIAQGVYPFTSLSFSPDGSRIAFLRFDEETGTSTLVTASRDGREEASLASAGEGRRFNACAWSPDALRFVCNAGRDDSSTTELVEVDAVSGEQQVLSDVPALLWPEWLPGYHGLVGSLEASTRQLWRVDPWDGTTMRLTNDLANYSGAVPSADGARLAAKRIDTTTNLWTVDAENPDSLRQVTTGANTQDGNHGVAATPDGRIVWASGVSGESIDLWTAKVDGTDRRRLTFDDESDERRPAVSPDGRSVVYMRDVPGGGPEGVEIWRTDIGGTRALRLVDSGPNRLPAFSADGKTVLFSRRVDGVEYLFEVPETGGEIRRIGSSPGYGAKPSPDGKWLMVATPGDHGDRIELWPTSGDGDPVVLPISGIAREWRPDGGAIAFLRASPSLNVWLYVLGTPEPRPLTGFGSGDMAAWALDWLPDGKTVVFPRRTQARDVILIDGLSRAAARNHRSDRIARILPRIP